MTKMIRSNERSRKILDLIGKARTKAELIECQRNSLDDKQYSPAGYFGYVMDYNEDLVLLQLGDQHQLAFNGYAILRAKDITGINSDFFKKDLYRRYFKCRKMKLRNPGIDIGTCASALADIDMKFELFGVECERIKPNLINIGRLKKCMLKKFEMHLVDTSAEWHGRDTFLYDDLTVITFDDTYEKALKKLMVAEGHFNRVATLSSLRNIRFSRCRTL